MKKNLSVPEVHCEHCVSSIETAVGSLDGVQDATVDLESRSVTVSFDEAQVALERIVEAIEDQGYDVGDGPRLLQIEKPPS